MNLDSIISPRPFLELRMGSQAVKTWERHPVYHDPATNPLRP
jgi:hypothetical protein